MLKSLIFFLAITASAQAGLKEQIITQSQKAGVDPALALAIVRVESSFNPAVVRFEPRFNTYSAGLFQVFLPTAKSLGFNGSLKELLTPGVNIFYGLKYLKLCRDRFGNNIELNACCYNAGVAVRESVCVNNVGVREYVAGVVNAYRAGQTYAKQTPRDLEVQKSSD